MNHRRALRRADGASGVGNLLRRHSTGAVLFHHALAERLGLGPTDLKCLDLLREHGSMTGSELAAVTSLTTGAITGVVARLAQANLLRRAADANDGRRQILTPIDDGGSDVHALFARMHADLAAMLAHFSAPELAVIRDFLIRSTELIYEQIAELRAEKTLVRRRGAARARAARPR